MYSFPNLEAVCCSTSSSNHCLLTCKQISQKGGKVDWYSYLFKNFLQFVVIHTVKGFSIVNEADVFWTSLAFSMIPRMLAIWSLVPLSFKSSLYIWMFLVHVLLKSSLKDFEHYLAGVWDECNCAIVWTCFGIALLWNGMKTDLFQSYGSCRVLLKAWWWFSP